LGCASRRRSRRAAALLVAEAGLGSRQKTIALRLLSRKLAGSSDSFGLLTHSFLRGLLIEASQFHFAEDSLSLHPLLEDAQGLINIVFTHKNLQSNSDLGWRL
jgi:hypothetical protein